MSMENAARPPFDLPRLDLPEVERKRLPTMFDLPSNAPEDPGVPDIFHALHPQLLDETFVSPQRRLWLPAAGLGIGLWEGDYKGMNHTWLRCFDAAGRWLRTQEEQVLHEQGRAEQERLRAERERQNAERERRNAKRERQNAEQARLRAEKLAAQLRTLGIEPDA